MSDQKQTKGEAMREILRSWADNRVVKGKGSPLDVFERLKILSPLATAEERQKAFTLIIEVLKNAETDAVRWEAVNFVRVIIQDGFALDLDEFVKLGLLSVADSYHWVFAGFGRLLSLQKIEGVKAGLGRRFQRELENVSREFVKKGGERNIGVIQRRLDGQKKELRRKVAKVREVAEKEIKEIEEAFSKDRNPHTQLREELKARKEAIESQLEQGFSFHFPKLREEIYGLERTLTEVAATRKKIIGIKRILDSIGMPEDGEILVS